MNPLRGIALKIASVVVFVAMSAIVKATSDSVPPGEAVFFRSAFAAPVIVVWLAITGDLRTGFATANPVGHFWRGLLGVTAMGFGFAGLGLLPLPEVTAIGYAAPLLTVIFAAMFLGEQVRLFRIAAVALGLAGVLIVLSPRLTTLDAQGLGATEALGAIVVLTGAVFASLAQVFVRKLVGEETTSSIVFWFSVNAALLSLVTLPFGWVVPDAPTIALLVLTGFLGGVGQILLTSAYRHADTSVVAPFEYVSMLLAVLVGLVLFGEVPTLTVLAGTALIVVAGIVIIWRERQLGIERAKQRGSMSP
jgi:drug/metabolite transporter (DMT)-like permease